MPACYSQLVLVIMIKSFNYSRLIPKSSSLQRIIPCSRLISSTWYRSFTSTVPISTETEHKNNSNGLSRDKYWIAASILFTVTLGSYIYSSHNERIRTRKFFTSSTELRRRKAEEEYATYQKSLNSGISASTSHGN